MQKIFTKYLVSKPALALILVRKEKRECIQYLITCSVTVDRGTVVMCSWLSIAILFLGKSWTVTATAYVPSAVCVAERLMVHVFCGNSR